MGFIAWVTGSSPVTTSYSTLGERSGAIGTVGFAGPRTIKVAPHQARITAAITVVAIMIFSALRWIVDPEMFWR
jgi:hypothetical protein